MIPAHIPDGTVNQEAVGIAVLVVLLVLGLVIAILSTAIILIVRKFIRARSERVTDRDVGNSE